MKVLIYAWNIYDESLSELQIKPNGGSIAIKNICEYIGRKCELYLFIGQQKMSSKRLGSINIVDTTRFPDYIDDSLDENECKLRTMCSAFVHVVKDLQPDFVNLHGNGDLARMCVLKCIEMDQPYAFTEHLYIGLKKKLPESDKTIGWEKQIFNIPNIKITAVGTMMKHNILRDYPAVKETNIEVILNGTDFTYQIQDSELRVQYGLMGKKILLCVGSIVKRKNQIQLVHAFEHIEDKKRKELAIIFCGADRMNGKLEDEIKRLHLERSLIYVGTIPNSEMRKYYSIADGYILPSLEEGLSLTMLEALVFGLPVIMFDDTSGASDLADENVTQYIYGKEDQDVANAIERWIDKDWDKNYIRKFAEYFTMERVAQDYLDYYEKRLNEKYQ